MKHSSLYGSILNYIKDGIKEGRFPPNSQIPTEMELVSLFKVSRPTVNKALNELNLQGVIYRVPGKGSFVSTSVQEEKSRTGTKIISLIIPFDEQSLNNNYEIEVMRGAESYLRDQGYFLTLNFSGQDAETEKKLIRKCIDEGVDGIILHPAALSENTVLFAELYINEQPIVLLDRNTTGIPLTCVQSDNLTGGYEAARHLIETGYDELFFVSHYGIHSIASVRDRFMGFYRALRDHEKTFNDTHCITNFIPWQQKTAIPFDFSFADNPDAFRQVMKNILKLSTGKRCGIFAINDEIATSLLAAANEMDVNVPGELGIVGFGGTNHSVGLLTTVRQDYFEIGRVAAKTVVNKICGRILDGDTVNVSVELVVRKTTAALDGNKDVV